MVALMRFITSIFVVTRTSPFDCAIKDYIASTLRMPKGSFAKVPIAASVKYKTLKHRIGYILRQMLQELLLDAVS